MMNNGFVCESANIEELDPAFDGAPIARERMDGVTLDCVMSNSFGFGGTNATLVFRRHDAECSPAAARSAPSHPAARPGTRLRVTADVHR